MTKDELKEKLKSAAAWQKMLAEDYMELQRLRDNAKQITPTYSQALACSGFGQKLEKNVVLVIEQEQLIQEHMHNLLKTLKEVRQLIGLVDKPELRVVLQMRYLNYKAWEQIAAELGYSWRQVHRLHGRALNLILKKYSS